MSFDEGASRRRPRPFGILKRSNSTDDGEKLRAASAHSHSKTPTSALKKFRRLKRSYSSDDGEDLPAVSAHGSTRSPISVLKNRGGTNDSSELITSSPVLHYRTPHRGFFQRRNVDNDQSLSHSSMSPINPFKRLSASGDHGPRLKPAFRRGRRRPQEIQGGDVEKPGTGSEVGSEPCSVDGSGLSFDDGDRGRGPLTDSMIPARAVQQSGLRSSPRSFDDDAPRRAPRRNVSFDVGHPSEDLPKRADPSPRNRQQKATERARYSVYQGKRKVKTRYRVRPYHCFKEPVNMTEEEIYEDSLKPSRDHVFLKSYLEPSSESIRHEDVPLNVQELFGSPRDDGRIGAIRVEVLGCVGLGRTKPDVCVYLVCGDSAFCTDKIQGYRSPMWPRVSRRSAVFPLHHAFAQLYVGVFDCRMRKNKENDVFCGRVVLDVAAVRPDTEYDVTMPLRHSSCIYDRRKRGVIRLRFALHWFNERAAAISYFKPVRSRTESSPLVEGQPAIPCADPKTFRNVAVTVYGADLPGKYSRNAFRSTMREFNLYQQNLRLVLKTLLMDAMLYEKPYVSFYLFAAAMYCAYLNSVSMVPAFVVGYILILYIDMYKHFVEDENFNLGYKPLTLRELFDAVFIGKAKEGARYFDNIFVQKKTKKRRRRESHAIERLTARDDKGNGDESSDGEEIAALDHREFPFSEREAYPKFSVEDALAPGSGRRGSTGRLHGRLSVYYAAAPATENEAGASDEEEDSEEDSDRDDETVMTETQLIGDSMFDLESDPDEDDDEPMEGLDFNYKRAMMKQTERARAVMRRIRLGPPQDIDVQGKKIPPQVILKRVENTLHKVSLRISQELIHERPQAHRVGATSFTDNQSSSAATKEQIPPMSKRAKKLQLDDFDKLLGLQSRTNNPINRIASSFLGPLMRMIRVGVYLIRIAFNVSTWRDPFLSFWIFVFLSTLCVILVFFPWRSFFLLASLVCLGPQNILVRKHLENKLAEKEKSERDGSEAAESPSGDAKLDENSNQCQSKSDPRRGYFLQKFRHSKDHGRGRDESSSHLFESEERPAFQSALYGQLNSSKKYQPKLIAVPYSRMKKDRFYDWPPDPTVSKASPMHLFPDTDEAIDSLTASVPDRPIPEWEDPVASTLRRRQTGGASNSDGPLDIPRTISFETNSSVDE